jgi:choline kinase
MKTIVLAAGTGSRLKDLTTARTKGMVEVGDRKLIDYLLDFLDIDMMDEIVIVGGFYYEDLKNHVDSRKNSKIRVIENKEYLKGNIFTLMTGLKEVGDDSFLITNVDHIYPKKMFTEMKKHFSGIRAMCDFDRTLGADDMKVKLEGDKVVGISKQLSDFDCGYIGMTYVDKSMNALYRKTIDEVLSRFGEKAVAENILHVLSESSSRPGICDLSGFGWYEVDTPDEKLSAEEKLKTDPNFK